MPLPIRTRREGRIVPLCGRLVLLVCWAVRYRHSARDAGGCILGEIPASPGRYGWGGGLRVGRIGSMAIRALPMAGEQRPLERATEAIEREPGNGKQYSLWTIGCQMNESESAQIGAALELAGYRQASQEAAADIIVLNS